MGNYVAGALLKDEKVLNEATISLWPLLPVAVAVVVAYLIHVGVGILVSMVALFAVVVALINYKTTELALTNKRIIAKFGLVSRRTIEMNLAKVESVQVRQGIFGRIFNYGSLVISGAGDPKTPVPNIASPLEFRRQVMEAQDQAA